MHQEASISLRSLCTATFLFPFSPSPNTISYPHGSMVHVLWGHQCLVNWHFVKSTNVGPQEPQDYHDKFYLGQLRT